MSGVLLKDYIQEVCEQIVQGVRAAQENEDIGQFIGVPEKISFNDETSSYSTEVEFHVHAEVTNERSGGGKLGVKVVGAEGKISAGETFANKISFKVPVAIPLPRTVQENNAKTRQNLQPVYSV